MLFTSSIFNSLKSQPPAVNWEQLLSDIISFYECSTGTIHFLDHKTNLLMLKAQKGIPDYLLPKMTKIPIGKGMAGIAAETKQPVEMCNLQTDSSGVARPAAKETKVEGSVAVPMILDGELYGTLGIAKSVAYNFSQEEINSLMKIGEEISRYIQFHPQHHQ